MERLKRVEFLGDSLARLRGFPQSVRREAGFQLQRVQAGLEPNDWKPMSLIGRGVREIRIRDEAGAFRVIYATAIGDTVYVLHAFEKKSQKTARKDLDLARLRLRQV